MLVQVFLNRKTLYQHISEFKPYYDRKAPYSDRFNTRDGVIAHEQQHVKEYRAAYYELLPDFKRDIAAIRGASKDDARQQAGGRHERFQIEHANLTASEDAARQAEWSFYYRVYEAYLAKSSDR
ncbi:MAG: hypothetical protein NXI24_10820 [bacterium]|nr:hypothetical protein [bacterium]